MVKNYNRNWRFFFKSALVAISCLAASSSIAQLSGTYTVNSAVALGGTNFQTFTELIDTLDANGVNGAITVNVVSGSGPYSEAIILDEISGVSATNSITINGNNETITGAAPLVEITETSYVTVKKLRMLETGGGGKIVHTLGEIQFFTLDSCELIASGLANNTSRAYVWLGSQGGYTTDAPDASTNVTISNNKMWKGYSTADNVGKLSGIVFNNSASDVTDQQILITKNDIQDIGTRHLQLRKLGGVEISFNDFHNENNTNNATLYAMFITNWPYAAQTNDFLIEGNHCHDMTNVRAGNTMDLYFVDFDFDGYGGRLDIVNNVLDLQGPDVIYGIQGWANAVDGTHITGNTIALSRRGTSTTGNHFVMDYNNTSGGSSLTNNIFADVSDVWANTQSYLFDGNIGNFAMTNNNWFFSSAIPAGNINFSTADDNFIDFIQNTPANATNVNTDPSFVDLAGGNLIPNSIGMANKGTSVAAFPNDFAGVVRNLSTPDIGAYEYYVDVEVVSVDMTTSNECAPYEESVKFTVKNNGAYSISNIPFACTINGSAFSAELLGTNIAAGATASLTFTDLPTFFGSAAHSVGVSVDGIDDLDANSSASGIVTTTASPTGGDLTMGTQFDGYFNSGSRGDMDAVVNNYISNYDITDPTMATNYSYTLTAVNETGTDVTSSGFSLINGDKGVEMNPALTLAGDSIFVQIEVLDNTSGCDTSFGRFVYIPHVPVADFIATDICFGNVAQFKNTSTLGGSDFIAVRWEFNDPDASILGDTSGIVDGFWEYSAFTTAPTNVEMTAFNAVYPKFKYLVSKQINVTPTPIIDFKVLNACEGLAISVLNTTRLPNDPNTGMPVTGTITYDWDFGGEFTSTAAVPSHVFTTSGQRDLTLVASANGCDATLTKNAYQFERPEAGFSSEGACNFVPVSFINESIIENNGNMGYQWDFNGEGIARANDPMFAFATPGTKTVTLTATSEFGCENTTTRTVTLEESPQADFTWEEACNLTPVSFTRTGSVPLGGVNSDFFWDFDGEGTTTQENPEHLFSNLGLREVTLTIVDGNGCTNEITKEVNVVLEAVADFEAEDACSGEEVVFTNTSEVAAGGLEYEWRFGDDNTSSDLNPTHIYGEAKTYDVTLSANVEGGCSSERTKTVTVFESPDAGFIVNKGGREVSVTASDATNDTYNWTFGNGSRGTSATATNTYDNVDAGTFTICLATKKGVCWSDSCEDITINLAGVENLTQANDMISVYPNPSQGQFTVAVDNASEVVVKVGDILGNVIAANVIDNLNGTYSVDMSAVADGVYFVQVKNGDFYATKRITISK